jgi:predicted DCC family thiol-disulfide oxidoreductase YuxK
MMKPLLVYDGDCNFCRRWIERWRKLTGDRVDYASSQEVADRFPQIPKEKFAASVILIDSSGVHFSGAEAVFRTLVYAKKKWPLWFYEKIPGVAGITEWFYRLVACHRVFFSFLTKIGWGSHVESPTYFFTRRLFFGLLGITYLVAFVSLVVQIKGLVGSQGILPANEFLNHVGNRLGHERYWLLPTLFWFNSSDVFLQAICWCGAVLSLLVIAGIARVPVLLLLWFFYLSLFHIGRVFLGYQWDILLLETGFLAIFFAADSSNIMLWLLRWLLFRLTFSSGLVKILSGDLAWRNFTALQYHYETQPLPTWIGYYAHQLPIIFQKISLAFMFGVELFVPFLIFFPRRIRMCGAALLIFLQLIIMATGNYGFFNLLTIALCLLLIDDAGWSLSPSPQPSPVQGEGVRKVGEGRRWVMVPVAIFIFTLSWIPTLERLGRVREWPTPLKQIYSWVDPFNLVNSYGLFAVMTKTRTEITIEGSRDGKDWMAYEFKWKPGDLREHPRFVEPHQPRLDWQMWFQALAPYRHYGWFENFLLRLLEGSPDVLKLMKSNPFPDAPPAFVRAMISEYHFTDLATKRATGQWWEKGMEREYSPVLSLEGEDRVGRSRGHN